MNKTLLLKYILYSPFSVITINHSHSAVEFNPLIGKPLLNIFQQFQQGPRNAVMELNRKGLCLQEFTILLDFSVKSFVALQVKYRYISRISEESCPKKDSRIQERITGTQVRGLEEKIEK